MDGSQDHLLRIESQLGHLNGKFDGMLRELTRLVAQFDQHITEDREVHAQQDERLLRTFSDLSERRAADYEGIRARIDAIEKKLDEGAGARWAGDRWRGWVITALGTASGFLGGILSHITFGGHH